MMPAPKFAILTANPLIGLGLKSLLERIIPGVEIEHFSSSEELVEEERKEHFFHYFVDAGIVLEQNALFRERFHRTILLVEGEPQASLKEFHCLNIRQTEAEIVRDILRISRSGHHAGHPEGSPGAPRHTPSERLTPREGEVWRLLARGRLNKEIAHELGVGLTTVISHRRNLTSKLGIRSLSALTIYAVLNGYVDANAI